MFELKHQRENETSSLHISFQSTLNFRMTEQFLVYQDSLYSYLAFFYGE